jgi:transcriptional regulator with XRE-family HTH domain
MDIRKQFGLNVKALREAKGLSQEGLSFDTGIHRTYISDIERGARNPSLQVIERMAKGLDLTPGELLDYHMR